LSQMINTPYKYVAVYSRWIFVFFLLLFLLILVTACDTNKDRSEDIAMIYELMDKRKSAVAQQDIELYKSVFLPDYSEYGISNEDIEMEMQQLFSKHESIVLSYPRTRPNIKMNSARIIHTVLYTFSEKLPTLSFQETLLLRKSNDIWYISGGIKPGMFR